MKMKTLLDGLSECINDYVEGDLDPATEKKFQEYLEKNVKLGFFVHQSYEGMLALQNAYKVTAADDFEEKLAKRIAEEKRNNRVSDNEAAR